MTQILSNYIHKHGGRLFCYLFSNAFLPPWEKTDLEEQSQILDAERKALSELGVEVTNTELLKQLQKFFMIDPETQEHAKPTTAKRVPLPNQNSEVATNYVINKNTKPTPKKGGVK